MSHRYDRAIFLVLTLLLLAPPFLLPPFLLFQASTLITYAIAIMGMNLLLGFSGQVSLAQGAFFALGAYVFAIFFGKHGYSSEFSILSATIITAAVGVIIGLPAIRLAGLQLAIVTFGFAALVPQLLMKFDGITGGFSGIRFRRPAPPSWFEGNLETWSYSVCVVTFLICAVLMFRVVHGDSGRTLRALRDSPLIAESFGVNLTRARLFSFGLSAGFAGIGGALFAMLNGAVNPTSFEATKSIEFLIGSIVGGAATVSGAILGAVFVILVPEFGMAVDNALAGVVFGALLILTVMFARSGLVGSFSDCISAVKRSLSARHQSS